MAIPLIQLVFHIVIIIPPRLDLAVKYPLILDLGIERDYQQLVLPSFIIHLLTNSGLVVGRSVQVFRRAQYRDALLLSLFKELAMLVAILPDYRVDVYFF